MRPASRTVLAVLSAGALVSGLGTGCSGGQDSPGGSTAEAPTMAEFCAAATDLDEAGEDWERAHAAARRWRAVGVPQEAPGNVRRGVEKGLELILRAKNARAAERLAARLSPQQQDDIASVDGYLAEECTR